MADAIASQPGETPQPARWSTYDPLPDADYVRLSPGLIRPDPVLGNVRHAVNAEAQAALEATVAEDGVLQPIAVRFVGADAAAVPVLVWGSRRLRAALAAGVPEITVRNLGRLSDRDALLYQVLENDHAPLHPADDALAIARLVDLFDGSQVEVARRTRRSEATISILRRAGDALSTLPEEAMGEIYASGVVTKRAFMDLAPRARSAEQMGRLLLDLVRKEGARRPGRPRGTRRAGPSLEAQPNERGGGEVFVVRWRDADLARDPVAFTDALTRFIEQRLDRVARRLEALRRAETETRTGRARPARDDRTHARADGVPSDDAEAIELERFEELLREADARVAAVRERLRKGLLDG